MIYKPAAIRAIISSNSCVNCELPRFQTECFVKPSLNFGKSLDITLILSNTLGQKYLNIMKLWTVHVQYSTGIAQYTISTFINPNAEDNRRLLTSVYYSNSISNSISNSKTKRVYYCRVQYELYSNLKYSSYSTSVCASV